MAPGAAGRATMALRRPVFGYGPTNGNPGSSDHTHSIFLWFEILQECERLEKSRVADR